MSVPETSWLHHDVRVGLSPIAGMGLFAEKPLPAGAVVMRLGGRLIDDRELQALKPPYSSLCIGVGAHILLDPDHPVRFGNHSCEASMWHEDATTVATRRSIQAGEELTIDYATHTMSPDWSMPCACGAQSCRGVVTGSDWQRPRLQAAYGRHWTPPLLDAIAMTGRKDR